MKATRTKPAERALGCAGFVLSVPALAPVTAVTMGLARWSKSDRLSYRALAAVCGVLVFPLFVLAIVAFIPYFLVLQILAAAGLVRRELPPMLMVVSAREDYWRLDLSVPQAQRVLAETMVEDLRHRVLAQEAHFDVTWMEEAGRVSAEISMEGDVGALCRSFVDAIENEHPTIEVHRV